MLIQHFDHVGDDATPALNHSQSTSFKECRPADLGTHSLSQQTERQFVLAVPLEVGTA